MVGKPLGDIMSKNQAKIGVGNHSNSVLIVSNSLKYWL